MNPYPIQHHGNGLREACWIDGEPLFDAEAIGACLGATDPANYVHRLVSRHPEISGHTRRVHLPCGADGRQRAVTVFDGVAVILILLNARLPGSIPFQIAYAQFSYEIDQCAHPMWEWAERFMQDKTSLE